MNPTNNYWPQDRIDAAEQLYRDKLPMSRMAEKLETTRGAIAGMIHRQGWRLKYPREKPIPHKSIRKVRTMSEVIAETAPIINPIDPATLHELPTILEIHDQCCKYPVDDGPPTRFCGETIIEGRIYCDGHRSVAFRVPASR